MVQGRGEDGKEEVKKATFATLLTTIVAVLSLSCTSGQNYCWLDKINCWVCKCISLAKRITWQQNSGGHFLLRLKFELFLFCFKLFSNGHHEKGKVLLLWHFGSFFCPWGIKHMAMQSCFFDNTIFIIICLRLLDGGLSLDHCRCDRSIFDRCTFFFRHPSSCSGHTVAIITPCITQKPVFTEALTIFTFSQIFQDRRSTRWQPWNVGIHSSPYWATMWQNEAIVLTSRHCKWFW